MPATKREARHRQPTLWGIPEIADAYEVDRSTVYYWAGKPGFPEPLAELAQGRVWDADQITEWKTNNVRPRKRPS